MFDQHTACHTKGFLFLLLALKLSFPASFASPLQKRVVPYPEKPVTPASPSMAPSLEDVYTMYWFEKNRGLCEPGQVLQRNDTVCCWINACEPGFEIEECQVNGTEDKCRSCPSDFEQPNNVSSLDMANAKCFKKHWSHSNCPGSTRHASKNKVPVLKYPCECKFEECRIPDNFGECELQNVECGPNHQMNKTTGMCEPCPLYTYKNKTGCEPCTLNITLIRSGRPDNYLRPEITGDSVITTTPVGMISTGSTEMVQTTTPDKEDGLTAGVVISLAVLASALVFILCVFLVLWLRRRRMPASQQATPEGIPLMDLKTPEHLTLPNGHRTLPNGVAMPNGHRTLPNGVAMPNGHCALPNGNAIMRNGHSNYQAEHIDPVDSKNEGPEEQAVTDALQQTSVVPAGPGPLLSREESQERESESNVPCLNQPLDNSMAANNLNIPISSKNHNQCQLESKVLNKNIVGLSETGLVGAMGDSKRNESLVLNSNCNNDTASDTDMTTCKQQETDKKASDGGTNISVHGNIFNNCQFNIFKKGIKARGVQKRDEFSGSYFESSDSNSSSDSQMDSTERTEASAVPHQEKPMAKVAPFQPGTMQQSTHHYSMRPSGNLNDTDLSNPSYGFAHQSTVNTGEHRHLDVADINDFNSELDNVSCSDGNGSTMQATVSETPSNLGARVLRSNGTPAVRPVNPVRQFSHENRLVPYSELTLNQSSEDPHETLMKRYASEDHATEPKHVDNRPGETLSKHDPVKVSNFTQELDELKEFELPSSDSSTCLKQLPDEENGESSSFEIFSTDLEKPESDERKNRSQKINSPDDESFEINSAELQEALQSDENENEAGIREVDLGMQEEESFEINTAELRNAQNLETADDKS